MQKEFEDKKKKYDDDKKLFDVKKQKYNEDKSAFDNRGLFSGITDPGAEPSFDETEPKPVVLEDVPELDEQDLKWVEEPGKADNGQMVLMNPTSKGKSWLDFKEFCLQKFSECREAKEALDAAKRANPKQQTETYRKVPFVKTPYIFTPCSRFEKECKAAHASQEQEIRAKYDVLKQTLQEQVRENERKHTEAKTNWETREKSRVEAHKEYMLEAGKLKKLIKQMEHAKGDTTTLKDVINSLTLVVRAMGKIKTAFASVRMYWDYVRNRSKWMIDKCKEIADNAKALADDGEEGETTWFDIEDAVGHIEESANVWMSLCLQSWRAAEQIQCAEVNIDRFMEDLGGKDNIGQQCAELLKVLDEEEMSDAPRTKQIDDLPGGAVKENFLNNPADEGCLTNDAGYNAICKLTFQFERMSAEGKKEFVSGSGTGFWMMAPGQSTDCIMTNNHVLGDEGMAESATVCFGYRTEGNAGISVKLNPRASNGGLFYTNKDLDFTLVAIDKGCLAELRRASSEQKWGPLLPASNQFQEGDIIYIKGHPFGKPLEGATKKIKSVSNTVCSYDVDTAKGMSGSPVFLTSGKVAILHAEGATFANQGYNMQSIIADILHNYQGSGKDAGGDGEWFGYRAGTAAPPPPPPTSGA